MTDTDSKILTLPKRPDQKAPQEYSLIHGEQLEITALYPSLDKTQNSHPLTEQKNPEGPEYLGLLADLEGTGKIMLDKIAPRQDSPLTQKKIEDLPGKPPKENG